MEVLTSPAMTGEWEQKLRQIEEGKKTRASFMEEISSLTRDFVEKPPALMKQLHRLRRLI